MWSAECVSPQAKSSWGKEQGCTKSRAPGRRGDKFLTCRLIHPALVLSLFAPNPLANFNHYLICAHFRFNALWLAAFYYPKSLFLIVIFFIYDFFIYAGCFRNATRTTNKGSVYVWILSMELASCLQKSKWPLSLRIPYQNSECISPLPHTCHIPGASHSP